MFNNENLHSEIEIIPLSCVGSCAGYCTGCLNYCSGCTGTCGASCTGGCSSACGGGCTQS